MQKNILRDSGPQRDARREVVAKFLLIAASHDAALDRHDHGLLIRGRAGLASTMKTEIWRSESLFSVEHIAPQARSPGWQDEIYETGREAYDRLGNLTLLPAAANSYVSSRSWQHKRLLYRYFASETEAEADGIRVEFEKSGLVVGRVGERVLGSSPHMPMCRAVSIYPSEWGVEIIEKRSQRLAELAYQNLVGWLG